MERRNPLVLFHSGCFDGFAAAWVAKRALGNIEAVAVQYNAAVPIVTDRDVYVLDFSFPRKTMEKMKEEANSILVLDHHKSAKEALKDLPFCKFEDDKSGGRMTWEHFFGSEKSPWLVDYTEDRDLWRHKLPNTMEINAALRSYPLDFNVWEEFSYAIPEIFVTEGRAIRRREQQIVLEHVRNARPIELLGHRIWAVNATVMFSEIANELAKGQPFAACYFTRQDGRTQWSLRSDENGVDVSEIAKRKGGGGHFHSAGFEE